MVMINLEIFLSGLLLVSTLTGLVTEAVKKLLIERKVSYYPNILAGTMALILSTAIGTGYIILTNVSFTSQVFVYLLALVFMSWLCAMVGYDKVIQTLSQLKTYRKDEHDVGC